MFGKKSEEVKLDIAIVGNIMTILKKNPRELTMAEELYVSMIREVQPPEFQAALETVLKEVGVLYV